MLGLVLGGCFAKPTQHVAADGAATDVPLDSCAASWSLPIELFVGDGGADNWPALSPDGQLLVYAHSPDGTSYDLYVSSAPFETGTAIATLATAADESRPAWRFDGAALYVTINNGSLPMVAFYTGTAFASPTTTSEFNVDGFVQRPRFTGDGLRVYYYGGVPADLYEAARADTNGSFVSGTRLAISDPSSEDAYPVVSPDGAAMIFNSARVGGQQKLYAASRSDRGAEFAGVNAFNVGLTVVISPEVSADGQTLFVVGVGAFPRIYLLHRSSCN